MKSIAYPFEFTRAARLGTLALFALVAAPAALAGTTYTWTGSYDSMTFDEPGNWTPTGGPPFGSKGDTGLFNGTQAGNLALTFVGTNNVASPGIYLGLTAGQTGSLLLNGATSTGFRLQGITLASGAGAFTLGNGVGTWATSTAFNVTIDNAGFTNNSTYTAIINTNICFASSGGASPNTITLRGNWTFHNNLARISTGSGSIGFSVQSGTINYDGTSTAFPNTSPLNVGTLAGSTAVLNFNGGATLVAGGNAPINAGTAGLGTINMVTGSSIVPGQYLVAGITTAGAMGIWNISGGTLATSGNNGGTLGATAGCFGQLNMTGTGSYTSTDTTASGASGIFVGENGTGTLNVSGSASMTLGGVATSAGLIVGGNTGTGSGSGVVNLGAVGAGGGTITAVRVHKGSSGTSGIFNFHGGTLAASAAASATFFTGLSGAYVWSEGGTVNNNGVSLTIAQPLLAPPGSGENSSPTFTGGAGYITAPYVTVIRGSGDTTGTNGTAVATVAGGVVTAITMTSPGVNYTATPTFTLSGGGYTTAATATGAAVSANTSGGLTFQGSGTTTLSGANTYTGNTVIGAGTLSLASGSSLASGNIVVSNGATFDVSLLNSGSGLTLGAGQNLLGSGTVNGSVSTVSGSGIYAGPAGGYGTNTFNNNLTLVSGATAYLNLGATYSGQNGLIQVDGTLTDNGSVSVSAPSSSMNLDTTADYVLITAAGGISGTVSATPIWGTKPLNWKNFTVVQSGNNIQLHYTAATPPTASGTATPASVADNQNVLISVTVTPGTGSIDASAGVTLNGSSLGLSSAIPLVLSSQANVYTNTITVPASVGAGNYTLLATVTDSTPLSGSANVALTVAAGTYVWDGAGANLDWDTSLNWAGALAPGYYGESLIFAGTTGLTPDMDQNYTVASITFSNNAGSFTLGSAENDTLTLTNSGVIANNSANAQTLSMTIADSGSGLTKTGNGPIYLTGNNTYTGPTTVAAGTLSVSGTVASTNIGVVASTAANAELINSGSLSQSYFFVGDISNAVGVVYQTGGTLTATSGSSGDGMDVGNIMGAFGYLDIAGGIANLNGIALGGENESSPAFGNPAGTGGNGVMDINGGIVTDSGWLVMARGAGAETGVLNVFSGGLTYAGGGLANCWGSGGQTAIINVLGGGLTNSAVVGINLNESGNATNTSVLNLNGGTVQANSVVGAVGQVNFNGGTLMGYNDNPSFMTGLGSVKVYGGGAVIDDNGKAIQIDQALLAPTGNGVNGVASFTPGAGYIAPPIVTVVPGTGDTTGAGATAIAQVDLSTGNPTSGEVTNVVITCPGVNYTATPTFVLSGGGASTVASITGQAPTANISGGFTKMDSGTVTLGGSSTYAGSTTVSNGILQLSAPVLHLSFDSVSGTTVVNQGTGGSAMDGTLTGTASIVAGGRFGNALSIPSGAATAAYVLVSSATVPLNITSPSNNWTLGMWLKTATAGAAYFYQGAGGWASGNTEFYLENGTAADGAGSHAGGVRYAQGWQSGTNVINDGNWHFVVMTCNNGVKAQYVDGSMDSLAINQWSAAGNGTEVCIGGTPSASADSQVGLNGLIDEVYIYNRALSQAEIQSLYTANNSQVLPTNTAVNVASGATLDIGGIAQTIGSLSGPSGSLVTLDDTVGAPGTLSLANTSSNSYPGTIEDTSGAGSFILNGTSALTLSGNNTYGGTTTVSNGTLWVDGSLASGSVTVAAGAVLGGSGTIGGVVTVNGNLSPGDPGSLSTLKINNNVTFAAGATCTFALSASASGANDQVEVSGALVGDDNVIHIKAPSTSVNLDTTSDYVLITGYSSLSGGFLTTPAWDVRPVNYQNYTVQNISGNIVLHYAVATAPTAVLTLTPNTVTRNANTLLRVTVTPGSNPISGVTVDTSSAGGPSTLALSQVGTSDVYTNTLGIAAGTVPGTYSFLATATDTASLSGTAGANLTVTLANDIWDGAGTDNNWDTNPNWVSGAAPGYAGDSVVFAGTKDLAPNLDNSYTVTSLTFSNNAGSFNLSSGNGSTLILTNASVVVNNSANAQTLNVPVVFGAAGTITAAAGDLTLAGTVDNGGYSLTVTGTTNTTISGVLSDTGGLTMSGSGTLTLTADNTYAGATTVSGNGSLVLAGNNSYAGATTVSGGTLSIPASGTVANDAITYVGASAGNSVLIDGGSLSQEVLLIGNANGAVGAVYQTNGTVSAATTTTFDNTSIGNLAGAFGYYDAIGGTFTSDGIAVGGENNSGGGFSGTGGNGIMDINGGVVTDTGWFVMARGATNETGVLNVYSGSLTFAGGGLVCNWGTNQTSVINVLGGSVANASADNNLPLNFNNGLGDVGILNCISGTFQTSWIEGGAGTVNFNGGTLAASKAQAVFLDGLAGAYVYGGGATINNNGYAVTIPQALLAPTGYGVGSISLSSGGQGYIAPPIVTLSGGSGSGATAIAQLNLATGVITNLLVTSAGINYLSSDTLTVTLAGGGGSGAVANPPVLTANTSGGLTATGSGSLTLTAGCTYTGNTVITNGTLLLGAGGSIADSAHINVTSGSTFDVSAANFTLATGQTLMGNGTVNGSVTNSGTVAPGTAGVIGALTFNNNLTLKAGGITSVKLNNSLATSNDLVTVSGALTYGGTLSVQNLGSALVLGNSYTLFSAGSATGSFASISGSPGAGLAYSFNAASGVLSVVTGVASNPTNLLYTVSGNALAIAWPTDHLGWILQAQTNSLPAGLGTNWVDVAGSANGTSASITIDATAPAVFYRLRHP